MKKTISVFVLMLTTTILFFEACTKEAHQEAAISKVTKTHQRIAKRTECRIFTDAQLDSFGIYHNMYVLQGITVLDFANNPNNFSNESIWVATFDTMAPIASTLGMSQSNYDLLQTTFMNNLSSYNFDARNFPAGTIDSAIVPFIDTILNDIAALSSISSFDSQMNILHSLAYSTLTCEDLETVVASISCAKYSVSLWAPTSIGGLGAYDSYIAPYSNHTGTTTPLGLAWWKAAVLGDVSGSCAYFAGIGIYASVGWGVPGANVVLLGGWAVSAALGSGLGVVTNIP